MLTAYAPLNLPDDIAGLLSLFNLNIGALLTTSSAKAEKTTAAGRALNAMHYGLPARALARAIDPANVDAVAPRAYLPDLAALAHARGLTTAARRFHACPYATAGCAAACLAFSGHGGLSPTVAAARGRRMLAMLADPTTYGRAILYAAAAQLQRARRMGLALALRLNGTTETFWPGIMFPVTVADAVSLRRRYGVDVETGDRLNIADALAPERETGAVALYEYCKAPTDAPDGLQAWRAAGWDVTYSFAADRPTAARDALAAVRAGFRVAVPVALARGAAVPARVLITADGVTAALQTVDGDQSDARYADPSACAVVLREKRAHGADREAVARFVLPQAPLTRVADGTIQLSPV